MKFILCGYPYLNIFNHAAKFCHPSLISFLYDFRFSVEHKGYSEECVGIQFCLGRQWPYCLRHASYMLQRRECHMGLKNMMYMMTVFSYFYSLYLNKISECMSQIFIQINVNLRLLNINIYCWKEHHTGFWGGWGPYFSVLWAWPLQDRL